jgi:hypothetical protein
MLMMSTLPGYTSLSAKTGDEVNVSAIKYEHLSGNKQNKIKSCHHANIIYTPL